MIIHVLFLVVHKRMGSWAPGHNAIVAAVEDCWLFPFSFCVKPLSNSCSYFTHMFTGFFFFFFFKQTSLLFKNSLLNPTVATYLTRRHDIAAMSCLVEEE